MWGAESQWKVEKEAKPCLKTKESVLIVPAVSSGLTVGDFAVLLEGMGGGVREIEF